MVCSSTLTAFTPFRAPFNNNLIRLKFNLKDFRQNYTYVKQIDQDCLKAEYIVHLCTYINISCVFSQTTSESFKMWSVIRTITEGKSLKLGT